MSPTDPEPERDGISFLEQFSRTPEQAEADARELAERAARQPQHPHERGRDRRQRRLQREAQRSGNWTP